VASADILIVQDERSTIGSELESTLNRLGYSVLDVVSLEESLQAALGARADLVLMTPGCHANTDDTEAGPPNCLQIPAPAVYLVDAANHETPWRPEEASLLDQVAAPFDDKKLSAAIEMALYRHRIEHALQESERRYRLLVETVSDVVWTTDLDMQTTDVSPSVSRLLGCSVEKALEDGMDGRLTSASLETATTALSDLRATLQRADGSPDKTSRLELEFICEDGATVWTAVRASTLRDSAGQPSGILWVSREITKLRPGERADDERRGRAGEDHGEVNRRTRKEMKHRATKEELERTKAKLDHALAQQEETEAKLSELNREWFSLQSAAAATASSLDIDFVLETVTWEMAKLLNVDGCAIFGWNRETDTISLIADYTSIGKGDRKEAGETFDLVDYPLKKRMLAERYSRQVTLHELDRNSAESAYMQKGDVKSLLALPMTYQDRVIGVVEIRDCQKARTFTDREIAQAVMLSTQAASAIENARLYERAQREIAHRVRAEGELKQSLREKEALLQEIHHRVKNNLQVICSLLNLQSGSTTDPESFQMLRESQDRVRSMALIHEKLYRSQDLAKVNFGSYLRDLTNHLMRSYRTESNGIQLKITADDVPLSIDKAVPCGLITNELISNALKHAFPAGPNGEIHVSLRSEPDQRLVLSIADNGVGLPADYDVDSAETLGLQLIQVLAGQIDGKARLHSEEGKGTEATITFTAS
jgi:PAS domain S-box-containing protein